MIKIKDSLKNFVKPSDHAVYGPSSANRWMACPFSIKFTEGIENQTSKYAEEGTFAHEVCEHQFRADMFGISFPPDVNLRLAQLKDGGEEMINCAESYSEVLQSWLKLDDLGEILWYGLEKGLSIEGKRCYGTADFVVVGTKGAAVIDFKYGKGMAVKKGSTQLKAYAVGILNGLEDIPKDYEFSAVIFQPRISMIPIVDTYTVEELREFHAEIGLAIRETWRTDLKPVEGNHCFWCPAKRVRDPNLKCPAIKEKAVSLANQNFDSFFKDMNAPEDKGDIEATKRRDKALMKIMSLAPLIAKMASDAEDEFSFRLQQGEAIEGVVFRETVGRRAWRSSDVESMNSELIAAFPGELLSATETVTKLKAIGKIEKIIGKKKLDGFTIQKISKKLIIMDEKVQEVLAAFTAFQEK